MLGLRLDEGLPYAATPSRRWTRARSAAWSGWAWRPSVPTGTGRETLVLTPRGRRLGGAVTVELLA